jgi:vancomycin aglycone glucosyltransferase
VLKCDRDERKGQKGTAWVQRYRSRLDVGASPRVRFSSMKFLVAAYGSRGDVEPCVAVGRELLRRGHDVRMAAPPNMLGLIESAGLAAVARGPDSQAVEGFRRDLSKIQNPISKVREVTEHVTQVWAEKGTTLTELADGVDLLVAGITEQGLAANVV